MTSDHSGSFPDTGRVQDRAVERQRDRATSVEDSSELVGGFLDEQKYPTTREELAVTYEDTMFERPNETGSLGDVFDRLVDERYESPAAAQEAVVNDLTGAAGGPAEYNDECALSDLDTEADGHSRLA